MPMLMLTTTAVLDTLASVLEDTPATLVSATDPTLDTVAISVATAPTPMEPTIILANVKLMLSPSLVIPVTMVVMLVTHMPAHMLVSIMAMAFVICMASRFLSVRSLLSAWNCQWILYKALFNPNTTLAGQRNFLSLYKSNQYIPFCTA